MCKCHESFGWYELDAPQMNKKGRCVIVGLAEDFGPKVLVSLKRRIPKIDWTKEQLLRINFSVFESSCHN